MRDALIFGKNAFCALFDGVDWVEGWESYHNGICWDDDADHLREEPQDIPHDMPPWLQMRSDGIYVVPPPPGIFDVVLTDIKDQIREACGLPEEVNFEEPICILKFPFSYNSFAEFVHRCGLYGDCNTVAFEAASKKYHTFEEAAKRLGIGEDGVFKLIKGGEIRPSVYLEEPIYVVETPGDGNPIQIVGLFEIEGLRGLQWMGFMVNGVNVFTIYMPHREIGVIDEELDGKNIMFLSKKYPDILNTKIIPSHSYLTSQIVVSDESLQEYIKSSKATIAVRSPTECVGTDLLSVRDHNETEFASNTINTFTYCEVDEHFSSEQWLANVVASLFWKQFDPEFNRPTETQITDWIMVGYEHEGITRKAATRVYQLSKPDNIPSHGNVSGSKPAFPDPPHPPFPR